MRVFFVLVLATLVMVVIMIAVRQHSEIRYAPLGDSYTIGTGVAEKENFPSQLVQDLSSRGINVVLVANLANEGWTSQDLIEKELLAFERSSPDFTTILVGANDFNRGIPLETFRRNLVIILDRVQAKLPDRTKVVLITIPDFSVTPAGRTYADPKTNSAGIAKFNDVVISEATRRGLPVVDVFRMSHEMGQDESLVAADGLHPSAKEYLLWERELLPAVLKILKR